MTSSVNERIGLPRAGAQPQLVKASAKEANEYLAPDKLVPTTGKLADIAAQQVQGHTGTMDRARALYDYVFATMKYDKTGTGWGRGDAEWACDSKRGNCTDFHSVFISTGSLARYPGPLRDRLPDSPRTRTLATSPVTTAGPNFMTRSTAGFQSTSPKHGRTRPRRTISSAPIDVNRVQFSLGRDLVLNPPQAGDPLNYFVYPYVEVDGKKWENVSNHFSFADIRSSNTTAAGR